jgi:PKD repeat protein
LNTQTSQSADNDKYDLPAEKDGCAKICGTPLQSGTFNVSVNVIANVQIAGDQSLSIPLTMYIAPAASSNNGFSMNPSGGCAPLSVSFTNNNPSNGMSGFSYNWNMGNGYQTTDENPTTQVYTNPGDYSCAIYGSY